MNTPTITIGIPTCYGGQSLIDTVASIRHAKLGESVRLLVTADRTPLSSEVMSALDAYSVELTWNEVEGSQTKKIRQMVEKTKSDIYIATQDDVTFDADTIMNVRDAFQTDRELTMAGVRILPLPPKTAFERAMGSMLRIVDDIAGTWNGGDNYLSSSGRCLAYRTGHLKRMRIPEAVVNSDMFFYLENSRIHGKFRRVASAYVRIRCPQVLKDQIAPSSRYLFSKTEMGRYFTDNLDATYRIPKSLLILSYVREFVRRPVPSLYYVCIRIITRVIRQSKKDVSDPVWKVDESTKRGGGVK